MVYAFLRGMNGSPQSGIFFDKPDWQLIQQLEEFILMLSLLKSLQEQGVITQGDYYFAQLIADKQKDKGYAEPVQKFSDFY